MKGAAVIVLALSCAAPAAFGYARLATGDGPDPIYEHWPNLPVTWFINDETSDLLPNIAPGSDPVQALRRAFQTWQDVRASAVAFHYGGQTAIRYAANDGVNLMSFVDDTISFNGALALNSRFRYVATGEIVDSDIVFNPDVEWATRGSAPDQWDIQQAATHEGGHGIGLAHSAVLSATMYPYYPAARQIERRLDTDDIAAVAEAYPSDALASEYGAIEGRVTRGGAAVFGAHVVAFDDDGRPVAAALSRKSGDYRISGLPPGGYGLYVEPLDGPLQQSNLEAYWTSAPFDLGFRTTFADGSIEIAAGGVSAGHDLALIDAMPSLSVDRIGLQPASGGSFSVSRVLSTVLQGDVFRWNVALTGPGLGPPTTFTVQGPGVSRVTSFNYLDLGGGEYLVIAGLDFAANAPAVPRVIVVDKAGEQAAFTGGLEILPSPAALSVAFDPLDPQALLVSWYGGEGPYTLRRDVVSAFDAPVTPMFQQYDLQFSDAVRLNGTDYYYRLDE